MTMEIVVQLLKKLPLQLTKLQQAKLFLNDAYCITDNISYTFNTSDDINTYNWDFGDTNNSPDESPTHQYASNGEYVIALEVESAEGCPQYFL